MLKKSIFILICLVLMLGVLSSSALAGPPWPAEVLQIRDGDFCYFPWVNSNYELITLTGSGMWTVQYLNGVAQWNCHTYVDYDDPYLLSLDEICALAPDLCNGNGSFLWTNETGLSCYMLDDTLAYNNYIVATPGGHVNLSCHFKYPTP